MKQKIFQMCKITTHSYKSYSSSCKQKTNKTNPWKKRAHTQRFVHSSRELVSKSKPTCKMDVASDTIKCTLLELSMPKFHNVMTLGSKDKQPPNPLTRVYICLTCVWSCLAATKLPVYFKKSNPGGPAVHTKKGNHYGALKPFHMSCILSE